MAYLNHVFLIGNLTRDPEVRYIPSGKAVADLRLAINRKYKSTSGEDREDTCFIDVVVWERQAEAAGKYLKKGSSIFVEGSLQLDEWESEGEKRSRIRVRAFRIQFLDRLKRSEFGDGPEDSRNEGVAENTSNETPDDAGNASGNGSAAEEQSDDDNLPF